MTHYRAKGNQIVDEDGRQIAVVLPTKCTKKLANDKELLELAARAAGIAHVWKHASGVFLCWLGKPGESLDKPWRPLDDDGDALRLAVKLRLLVDGDSCRASFTRDGDGFPFNESEWWGGGSDEHAGVAHDECDTAAATRRAIVRAAAAMAVSRGDAKE